jgi:energy-coupling factor transporter ATP-binding protein EcfA2
LSAGPIGAQPVHQGAAVTQPPALVVEDYSFWFKIPMEGKAEPALENVSFEIQQGEFVLVLGRSGSGKSTLALNLVGIYPDYFGGHNQGKIMIAHPERGLINRRELEPGERFQIVNMLFQNPQDQIVTLSVEEEVAFALENYLMDPVDIHPRIDRALDLVGLKGFRERSTLKLSGGEKQRVALASMLAMEPKVLILDEPTSNLDPVGTAEVLDAVDRIREHVDLTLIVTSTRWMRFSTGSIACFWSMARPSMVPAIPVSFSMSTGWRCATTSASGSPRRSKWRSS